MKKQTITHLTRFSLADRRFLFHPECAEWDASGSFGDVYDASGKKGLRVVCATCGAVLEEAPPLPSASCARCPECGGQWFSIEEFRKEKPQAFEHRAGIRRHAGSAAPPRGTPQPAHSFFSAVRSFITAEKLKDWIGQSVVRSALSGLLGFFLSCFKSLFSDNDPGV